MFNTLPMANNAGNHSDHMVVLAYQKANGGRKPGGTAEEVARQNDYDAGLLDYAWEQQFGMPFNCYLDEQMTPKERIAVLRERVEAWKDLADARSYPEPENLKDYAMTRARILANMAITSGPVAAGL